MLSQNRLFRRSENKILQQGIPMKALCMGHNVFIGKKYAVDSKKEKDKVD